MSLLQTLVNVSERAARIARFIRQEPHLFSLLVQEKVDKEKNERFIQDFKTLADVLIQETTRYYVSKEFPEVATHISGEEDATFTNTHGEKVTISISEDQTKTADLLTKILDGDTRAAQMLSQKVHEKMDNINLDGDRVVYLPEIDCNDIGIWIDPIDSTNEYISGGSGSAESSDIGNPGLMCVTVLLGMYERSSGTPVGGVVTQPFGSSSSSGWTSNIYWGVRGKHSTNLGEGSLSKAIVLSSSEDANVASSLSRLNVFHAPGAGYKCLLTARGTVDAYVCTKASTYQWDTAGPHALLQSIGGGIIPYTSLRSLGETQLLSDENALRANQLRYNKGDPRYEGIKAYCNNEGLIAYRDASVLLQIYECLKVNKN